VLLVQLRGDIAVLSAVTEVQMHYSDMDTWRVCSLLVHCRGEIAVLSAVTEVMLHYSDMDTCTVCSVLRTVQRVNRGSACSYCSTVT